MWTIDASSHHHHPSHRGAMTIINSLAMSESTKDMRMTAEIGMDTGKAIPETHVPIEGTILQGTTAIATATTGPQSLVVYIAMRCTLGQGEMDIASFNALHGCSAAPIPFEARRRLRVTRYSER